VPTDTLATSMDNVDIMIIGDLEEVEWQHGNTRNGFQ
jgi:hypothetical protein